MTKYTKLYEIRWTQPYAAWPQAKQEQEPELDLTQARDVLARIMSL